MFNLKRAAHGGNCIVQVSKIRVVKYYRELSCMKNFVGWMDYCLINFATKRAVVQIKSRFYTKKEKLVSY